MSYTNKLRIQNKFHRIKAWRPVSALWDVWFPCYVCFLILSKILTCIFISAGSRQLSWWGCWTESIIMVAETPLKSWYFYSGWPVELHMRHSVSQRPSLWNDPQSPWGAGLLCARNKDGVTGSWPWFCQACWKSSFLQSEGIKGCHIRIKGPRRATHWVLEKQESIYIHTAPSCVRLPDQCFGFSCSVTWLQSLEAQPTLSFLTLPTVPKTCRISLSWMAPWSYDILQAASLRMSITNSYHNKSMCHHLEGFSA